jgi:hypothetical protein
VAAEAAEAVLVTAGLRVGDVLPDVREHDATSRSIPSIAAPPRIASS